MMDSHYAALVPVPAAQLFNVFGYTPIERTLIALQKAGVKSACLVTATPDRLRQELAKNVAGISLHFFSETELAEAKIKATEDSPRAVFAFQQPLVVDISVLEEMIKLTGQSRNVKAASGELLLMQLADFQAGSCQLPVVDLNLGNRSCHPVRTVDELSEVKERLFKNLTKPADGWVSRHINRRVSKPISRVLACTSVTPNMATVFTGLLAFVPVYFMSKGGYWNWLAGAAIYQLASMLDGVDGELARLKMKHSKFGQWLDTLFDFTSSVAVLFALLVGVENSGFQPVFVPIAGYVAVFAGALSIVSLSFFVVRTQFGGNFRIRYTFYDSGSRWAKMLRAASFLGQRDFYIFFFLLLAIVGCLPWALVYVAVMAGLIFVLSLQTHFLTEPLRQLRA